MEYAGPFHREKASRRGSRYAATVSLRRRKAQPAVTNRPESVTNRRAAPYARRLGRRRAVSRSVVERIARQTGL